MRKQFFKNLACVTAAVLFFFSVTGCGLLSFAAQVGLIKLQFGCLPEGTYIDTPTGPVALQGLQAGDLVTGYNGQPVRILQKHEYLEDSTHSSYLRIVLENGAEVSASGEHRIEDIPAKSLRVGDIVAGQRVRSINTFTGVSKSYDFLT